MLNEKTEEYILENMNLVRYMASRYLLRILELNMKT